MKQEPSDQEPKADTAAYLWILALSCGLAIGTGIGAAIGSIGAGIGIGMSAGVAIGLVLYRRPRRDLSND